MSMVNWYFGWGMILAAFLTGAILGLFFYREDFLGGYGSFRRRTLRLGHIALAALGMINILYSISTSGPASAPSAQLASANLVVGGLTMPAICFLTSWRVGFRRLFFIPVIALVAGAILTIRNGPP
jgi:hypothetical protein